MNRTIDQWVAIGVPGCAKLYNSKHAVGKLLTDAVSDLQEMARQRDKFKKLALEYTGKLAAKSADALLAELEK